MCIYVRFLILQQQKNKKKIKSNFLEVFSGVMIQSVFVIP